MGRKFCVGGNWKMNGSKESITELAKILTTGPLDPNVEVIVGCPAIYISFARGLLPASIHVAGQVSASTGFEASLQPFPHFRTATKPSRALSPARLHQPC